MQKGIRVQQNQVLSQRELNGHVIGFRKAQVYRAMENLDRKARVGKFTLDHFRGTVVRSIVDHQNFSSEAGRHLLALGDDGLDALAQHVAGVEGDDDGGNRVLVRRQQLHRRTTSCFARQELRDSW